MEQDNINQFIQILLPSLATFLTIVFTYIGNKLKSAYQQKANNETSKQVVQDVVQFVQQVYKDLNGEEKLQKAIEQASTILNQKGIVLTEAEIYMLIESAVFGMKQGLTSNNLTVPTKECENLETSETSEINETEKLEENNINTTKNIKDNDDDLIEIL